MGLDPDQVVGRTAADVFPAEAAAAMERHDREVIDQGSPRTFEEMVPEALCDACLAFAFEVALDDVHAAVPRVLQASLRFTRKSSECFRCARTLELLTMR